MSGLTVIIVNYNVTSVVDECINSVLNILKSEKEVIVIDNNSPDRSIEQLKDKYPQVRFEFLKENLGYSKANNFGVNLSKFNFILLLNPDTIIIEDFAVPIIEFITQNEDAGLCGPMLYYKDMKFQFSNGYKMGYIYELAEALMLINIYRKLIKFLIRKKYNQDKPFIVNWMSGACLLVKKEIFLKAGGFNEQYFLNYEDIDLGNKITAMGFDNYYFPYLHCIHLDQTSQKKDFEKFTYSRYLSRHIYAEINYSIVKRFLIRIIHIIGLILRIIFTPFLYKGTEKKQRFSGYKKALKLYLNFEK